MRTIRVEDRDSSNKWLWLAAGATVGLTVGVLVARRRNGKKESLGGIVDRGRELAETLADNIGPLLDSARTIKDAWGGEPDENDEEWAPDLDDDDLDEDEDEEEEEDEDDDEDDESDEDEEEEDDDDVTPELSALDARVLEAFAHDPVLSARAIEIEEVGDGDIVLHGRVRSPREVRHAITMARGVPGVRRVRETLVVRDRR